MERRIIPLVIPLGRPIPEQVSKERLELFRWLASGLTDAECILDPPQDTINLNFSDPNEEPQRIRELLAGVLYSRRSSNAVVIIDLSSSCFGVCARSVSVC